MHYKCEFCDKVIESGPKQVTHTCVPADRNLPPIKKLVEQSEFVQDERGVTIGVRKSLVEVEVPIIRKADLNKRGTLESLETASGSDNELVQIKIVRKYEEGKFTLKITESTPEEIEDYKKECSKPITE